MSTGKSNVDFYTRVIESLQSMIIKKKQLKQKKNKTKQTESIRKKKTVLNSHKPKSKEKSPATATKTPVLSFQCVNHTGFRTFLCFAVLTEVAVGEAQC